MTTRKTDSRGAGWIATALFAATVFILPAGCRQQTERPQEEGKQSAAQGEDAPPFSMPGVVALVNGEEVTEEHFASKLREASILAKQATFEGRMEVLENIIDLLLVTQDAQRQRYDERDEVRRMLERERRKLVQRQVTTKIAREQISPTEEEIEEALGPLGELRDLSVLLVETEEEGQKAIDRIKAGEEWETVVLEMSTGPMGKLRDGKRPSVERGRTMYTEEIEDYIFSMEEGEVSPPLETPVGYLVVRVDLRREHSPEKVEKMRFETRTHLMQQSLKEKMDSIIGEELDKTSVKMVYDDFEQVTLPDPEGEAFQVLDSLEDLALAEVGGTTVTFADIINDIRQYRDYRRQRPYEQRKDYERLLQARIRGVALYNYARRMGWDESEGIDRAIADLRGRLLPSLYMKEVAGGAREAASSAEREEIRLFFEERKDQFLDSERLTLSQILVRRREESDEILGRLAAGGDFAELAREYSVDDSSPDGGDLGNRRTEDFSDIFGEQGVDDILVRARIGKRDPLTLRTTAGYHIILVNEYQRVGEGRFEDISELVRADYVRSRIRDALAEKRRQLWEAGDIRIDEEKVASVPPEEGPPPGFHGGESSPRGGGSPHGGSRLPGGSAPPGHP